MPAATRPRTCTNFTRTPRAARWTAATTTPCRPPSPLRPRVARPARATAPADPHPTASHTATASAECLDCHPDADVSTSHVGCNTCHGSPAYPALPASKTAECVDCHNDTDVGTHAYTPVAPNHYDETTHTASWLDTAVDAGGTATATCADCHDPVGASGTDQLYNQHQGLPAPLGDTSCVDCHRANAQVTAVVAAGWDPALCTSCHTASVLPGMEQHEWSTAPAATGSTTDTCLDSGCHATDNLHTLHQDATGCNLTGCHDFDVQGAKPTSTTCGAGGACHTGSVHTYNHTAQASAACVDCHEEADVSVLHAGCATCHGNPGYPSLPTGATPECVDCHNGSTVGTHAYAPPDPNHYAPSVSQHTASWQAGTESGYGCTQCHSLELKPAHAGPTGIAFDLGGYSDTCVACHELAVDNLAGEWGHTCTECHTLRHTETAVKHDATAQVLASPGSRYGGSSVGPGFSDGFEAGSFANWTSADYQAPSGGTTTLANDNFDATAWPAAWTRSSIAQVTRSTTVNHTTGGLASARIAPQRGSATVHYFQQTFNTAAYTSARSLSYWYRTSGLVVGDRYRVGYSTNGGTSWTYVQNTVTTNVATWMQITSSALPANSALLVRFELVPVINNSTARYFYIDDILLTGTSPTVSEAGWKVQNTTFNTGAYAAQATGSGPTWRYLTKTGIDASGGTSATLSYAIGWPALEAADDVVVQYTTNGGANWLDARNYAPAGGDPATLPWTAQTQTVPSNTNGVRFGLYADSSADDALYVDGVSVSAVSAGLNTAGGSCQDNPDGTDCHSVTDVSALHAGTTSSCTACHVNSTTAPILDCQASGCHVGVNLDEHIATGVGTPAHHESTISSPALFGAEFSGSWCTGCHDDSIANEHFVLGSYSATPCRICHRKSADSTAPTNVTRMNTLMALGKPAGTALCTDCHVTVSKQSIHMQRLGQGGAGGVQFADTWSGHRIYDSMPGSRTSFSNIAGIPTVSWSLPTVTQWLNAGWQSATSAVRCNDCHGSTSGPSGPHGETVTVNMQAGYDNSYQSGTLYLDNGGQMSNTTNLCAKCHAADLSYSGARTKNGHQGASIGVCINCHNKVPHAWQRPRLIGFPTDAVTASTLDREPWATSDFLGFTADAAMGPGYWGGKTTCSTAVFCHPSTAGSPLWP